MVVSQGKRQARQVVVDCKISIEQQQKETTNRMLQSYLEEKKQEWNLIKL